MKNIIIELHNIIKDIIDIQNIIYLSNCNTLDFIYELNPNQNIIIICHILPKDLVTKVLNSLENRYELKYIYPIDTIYNSKFDKFLNTNINFKIIEFEINIENTIYKFVLKNENKLEKIYPIHNLYLDLYNLEIYFYENETNKTINNIDNFITEKLLNEHFIQKVINYDNFIIVELVIGYIKYKNIIFKNLLDKFKSYILENKKFRKQMKHSIELGNIEHNIRIFNFLELNSDIVSDFSILLEKEYNIINKVLYGIDSFCSYNIEIKTIMDYLILILLNKLEIIDTEYIAYAKRYIKKNKKRNLDFNDISDISDGECVEDENSLEDENDDLLNDLFVDKFDDYRHIKKEANSKEIDKYLIGFDNKKAFYIKNSLALMSILFYSTLNTKYNIEMIKLGYIIKKFSYLKEQFMEKNLENYNKILLYFKLKNTIKQDNYFYKVCFSKKLLYYEITKMTEIPLIIKKYNNDEDIIDIDDFQDIFIFLYEFLLKNKIIIEDLDETDLDLYFESQMSNFRSNKMVKLNGKKKRSYSISNDENNDFFNWIGLGSNEINTISSVLSNQQEERMEDYLISSDHKDKNYEKDIDNEYEDEDEDEESNSDMVNFNYDSKNIKNMMYKLKYDRYKISYLKLKLVDKLLERPDFEIELLNEYDHIDEELVDKLLTKYSLGINFDEETSESEN